MTERIQRKATQFVAFLAIFVVLLANAGASVNVSPVRINLSQDNDKGVITITNQEDSTKSYEVEVVAWTQTDERREVYSPTDDILAVPPLFSLEPGEDQLVRVGMLIDADATTEQSYRMFITEIEAPDTNSSQTTGITMRLQIGIPVFVAPTAVPVSQLAYVDSMSVDDQEFLQFRNTGNTHIKVTEVGFKSTNLDNPTLTPAVMYILAGKTGYLPVDIPDDRESGVLSIVTENVGTLEYELPLAP